MPYQQKNNQYQLKEVTVRLRLKEGSSPLVSANPIDSPAKAADLMMEFLSDLDREMVCVINLNNKLVPQSYNVVSIGAINSSMAPLANIFKTAIMSNAASIMLAHNHPSGDPTPSREDNELTKRVLQAGRLMEIPLLDHIIVGSGRSVYYSYNEQQPEMLKQPYDQAAIDEIISPKKQVADKGIWLANKRAAELETNEGAIKNEVRNLLR